MRVCSANPFPSYRNAFSAAAALTVCLLSPLPADELSSPPKPARTQFDSKELGFVVNNGPLVSRPRISLPRGTRPVRTLHGEVVDAAGQPIAGAYVALASPANGSHSSSFHENYDKTDELGRFVVEDFDFRTTIMVSRTPRWTWRGQIDSDQTTLRVAWPANGRVRVRVSPELDVGAKSVLLHPVRTTTGVTASPLNPAELDDQRTATFDDVPPGDYRLFAPRPLKRQNGVIQQAERELGRFTIATGEVKDVTVDATKRVAVHGNPGPDAECVVIEHEPTRRSPLDGGVDGVIVDDDGRFTAHVPGPGVYRLMIFAKPAPLADPLRRPVLGLIANRCFVVGAATREVTVALDEHFSPTAAFVERTLNQIMFLGGDNAVMTTSSMADFRTAALVRYKDRAGVAAELLRILNDPHSSQSWEHEAIRALGRMSETPGVVDGLLKLLRRDDATPLRGPLIRALCDSKADLPRIAAEVAPFGQDEDRLVRYDVCYSFGGLVFWHPELRDQLTPTLIAQLADPFDRTRQAAAATLGALQCAAALPALQPLLSDRNIHLRLAAARALWQISGDAAPLITLTGDILRHDNEDYDLKKDATDALRGVPELPTRTIGALMGYVRDAPDKADIRDPFSRARRQLGSVSQEVLDEYVAVGDSGNSP